MKPHPDKALLDKIFPYVREYQNLAVKHGIGYLSEDRKQFGLLLDHWGTASVAATALLGVACALALWWLKPPPHPPT